MKTDVELKRDVGNELAWDPEVQATQIGVAVKNGVVTLTGHLMTFSENMPLPVRFAASPE